MPDVVRLTVDAIHTNGVPADAFQPDIQIGFLGVTPNDVVEGTALGSDERHAPAIVLQQPDHGFAGAIVREDLQRSDIRQVSEVILGVLQLQLGHLVVF